MMDYQEYIGKTLYDMGVLLSERKIVSIQKDIDQVSLMPGLSVRLENGVNVFLPVTGNF